MESLDSADFLLLGLIIQCLFFAGGLLFTKRGNSAPNHILSALLITFAVHLVLSILEGHGIYLTRVSNAVPFLFGPILFAYAKSICKTKPSWKEISIHLIWPLGVFLIASISSVGSLVISLVALIQFTLYAAASFYIVRNFNIEYNKISGSRQELNFRWILEVFCCFLGLMIINFRLETLHTDQQFQLLILVLFTALNFVGFRGILKPHFFLGISEDIKGFIQDRKETRASTLPKSEATRIAESIDAYLIESQAFTDQNLNLLKLAKRMELPARTMSTAINSEFKKNFSEYINSHRLKHAKSLLKATSNQEMNITQVVYASGFNSKTRFYTAFKKEIGKSPREYRDNPS